MKWLALLLILFSSASAYEQEEKTETQKRIEEIQSWTSPVGTSEGKYVIKTLSEELLGYLGDDVPKDTEVAIRLLLREDKASLSFNFDPDSNSFDPAEEVQLAPDKIGWQILMRREGGVWLERFLFSFTRIEEDTANFVVTLTVHNWHIIGEDNAPVTYYVVGAGQVTKTEGTK